MKIVIGNDEFILYIRKRYPDCPMDNPLLGKEIWRGLQVLDPEAQIEERDAPCYWGDTGGFVAEDKLPKTAAQFLFNREILPKLYSYLDRLGSGEK
jgi:hypothetical protein